MKQQGELRIIFVSLIICLCVCTMCTMICIYQNKYEEACSNMWLICVTAQIYLLYRDGRMSE